MPRIKKYLVFILTISLLVTLVPFTASAKSDKAEPLRLIVSFEKNTPASVRSEIHKANNASLKRSYMQRDFEVVEVPGDISLTDIKKKYLNTLWVKNVDIDHVFSAALVPNDHDYSSQWALPKIKAPQAWDTQAGSDTVTIAILDSGIDMTHPDLSAKIVPGYDFKNNDSNPTDDFGHGTKVSGVAAASTNNGLGIAGVSWGSKIMPIKVLGSDGKGSESNVIIAIDYAVSHGARVISMSFASDDYTQLLQQTINSAYNAGCVLVAAAGNDGNTKLQYPAACNNVIGVGATDSSNNKASFSNYNSSIDVVAPGVSIRSTAVGGGYGSYSGTSFAAPHVAGEAAIIFSQFPGISSSQVLNRICQSAMDRGQVGYDTSFGFGLIDIYRSLTPDIPYSFDFDDDDAGLETVVGWTSFSPAAYSTSIGYGYDSILGIDDRKRSLGTALQKDFHFSSQDRTFMVDLANGDYDVTVYIGDVSYAHDYIDVSAEGALKLDNVSTKAGEVKSQSFTTTVSDGRLDLRFHDDGGVDPNWVVNGVEISAIALPQIPVAPTQSDPVVHDGSITINWNGSSGATGYKVYYGTAQGGPYQNSVDAGNTVTANITGLTNGTTYYFVVTAYNGSGESSYSNEKSGAPVATPTPISYSFDFDDDDAGLETVVGWTSFSPAAYSTSIGYGYDSILGIDDRKRSLGTALQKDFHFSSQDRTFMVDLANGDYDVTVYIGDISYPHDYIDVSAEGVLKLDNVSTAAGEVKSQSFTATVSDGRLDLRFHDDGGVDPNWVVNGVEVSPITLPQVPVAPTQSDPAAHDGSVTVNWSGSSGATGYKVYYGTAQGGPYPSSVDAGNTVTTTINGLTNNTAYYFIVTAYNGSGESSYSNEKSGAPVATPTPISYSFDFDDDDAGRETVVGWTSFSPAAYSSSIGYGYDNILGIDDRKRSSGTALQKDFHFSSQDRTFMVDLANGDYDVTVYIGDISYPHDYIDVSAEGVLKLDNVSTAAGEVKSQSFTATVSDGRLDLRFHDDGGVDPNWVVNGIVLNSR